MNRLASISGLSILILLTLIPSWAMADSIFDEVIETRHNLGLRREETCITCHTSGIPQPRVSKEKSDSIVGERLKIVPSPLWIKKASNGNTEYPFSPDTKGIDIRPFGPSLDCVSCHDGVLASDVHGLGMKRADGEVIDPRLEALAPDGKNPFDHPTTIPYPRRSDGIWITKNPTINQFRYWSIPDRDENGVTMPTGPRSRYFEISQGVDPKDPYIDAMEVRTFKGVMHCDSCHNPHTEKNGSFLRVPIKSLCLVCHDR